MLLFFNHCLKVKFLDLDDIIGDYELKAGPHDNWHYVTIRKKADGSGYTWTNRAGVSWSLTYAGVYLDGFKTYAVGKDSYYYDRQNGWQYRTPTLFQRDNGVTDFQGPFYELYTKKKNLETPGTI